MTISAQINKANPFHLNTVADVLERVQSIIDDLNTVATERMQRVVAAGEKLDEMRVEYDRQVAEIEDQIAADREQHLLAIQHITAIKDMLS